MIDRLSPVPGLDVFAYVIRDGEYDRENAFIHSRDIDLTLDELETMLDAGDTFSNIHIVDALFADEVELP